VPKGLASMLIFSPVRSTCPLKPTVVNCAIESCELPRLECQEE